MVSTNSMLRASHKYDVLHTLYILDLCTRVSVPTELYSEL